MSRRQAVITGVGVAAPSGLGASAHWESLRKGVRTIAPTSLFDASGYDTPLAGEVTGFDLEAQVDGRLQAQTDRWTWLAYAAADQALADAELDPRAVDPYRLSVALASSSGGNQFGQRELQRLWHPETSRKVGAYQSIAWFYAATVGQLSIRHQAKGPSSVLVSESAGGLDSLGHAARLVERGASVVLAGGTEAPLSPYALSCQQRSGWLSTATDPDAAYLPFDADADGYVPGEGGAVLVVEDLEHALARGATVRAEIAGWAARHDGVPTRRRGTPPVRHYAAALAGALEKGGTEPGEVDLVLPDALGVPAYDAAECAALREVFEGPLPAVAEYKSLTGRLYQGGSALDAATAVLAVERCQIPASGTPRTPAAGCALPFVEEERSGAVDSVLIGSRGYDGFNSALLVRSPRSA
ncbi:beta-ketoacyl synthase N-terminal-like domain-containing protein [Streptomyces xiaopingdaonensis]|uniref:beta-ketoacyl synthase N-terminal-like domain-containing protein n=1 Tax=Streptomyces xiaopingdaonensis TaxID=1565415 RepID=UPI00030BA832|nr:beta-ketoacyl synthase N-terminal-like domain-containing protein [Streptomyces xiaopingdaonensis]